MKEGFERKHPIYWFDDGSVILDVEVYQFKVHHTLVARHSRFLSDLSAKKIAPEMINGEDKGSSTASLGISHIVFDSNKQIRADDVETLLQHLYHDVPLRKDSPFGHVASLLRISSPQQLDFPSLHETVKDILEGMFPTDPQAFTHDHPLHDALPLVTEYNLKAARKAVLYSLVTTTEFDISSTSIEDPQITGGNVNAELTSTNDPPRSELSKDPGALLALSAADSQFCTTLMTRIIEYFSPILFTAPAASHMQCTDTFAGSWMTLVIQPAIDDDGVYKPLETLQRIKGINWSGHGLCASCVTEKLEEWSEEQKTIWRLVGEWIDMSDPAVLGR